MLLLWIFIGMLFSGLAGWYFREFVGGMYSDVLRDRLVMEIDKLSDGRYRDGFGRFVSRDVYYEMLLGDGYER